MGSIFSSLGKTITAGVVLLVVIILLAGGISGTWVKMDHAWGMMVSARGVAPACDISLAPLADAVKELQLVDVAKLYDTERYMPKKRALRP